MSPIATIYQEPKEARPYLSARHDREDGPACETLFLKDPDDAAKTVVFYAFKNSSPSLFEEAYL